MSTTVKAADAAQFLSLVPSLLGFLPSRSVVLVPMSRSRSLGAMRADLPATDDPGRAATVASSLVGMICRIADADGFAVIVYTDATASVELPFPELAAAFARQADASGLRLVDSLVVAADGWGSHHDPECPPGGRPLAALRTTAAAGRAGLAMPTGDHRSGAVLPAVSAARRREIGAATRALRTALASRAPGSHGGAATEAALAAAAELDELPRLYERALTCNPADLPPLRAALLVWCLSRPALRDIALVQWAGDVVRGEDAVLAQHRWEDGEDYPVGLASVIWGEGPLPDRERLEAALALARHVAALSPRRRRPGPLSACAWLSWALGRSTHAECYAVMAHEIDPRHGMSGIVRTLVAAGHLPDWAFRRPT